MRLDRTTYSSAMQWDMRAPSTASIPLPRGLVSGLSDESEVHAMSDRPVRARRPSKVTKKPPPRSPPPPDQLPRNAPPPPQRSRHYPPRQARAQGTARSASAPTRLSPPAPAQQRRRLKNISEVRHFFRTNDVPILFFGATPFNLLGLDRWVRNFSYITYYDAWDGAHPRVFTPADKPYREFESGEEINNWLLATPRCGPTSTPRHPGGVRPKVAMVFFNSETEDICKELGYDLILPAASLRQHLDSKIVTTRLGNEAGAPSVPNVLTRVDDWAGLQAVAEKAGLGDELVVQTPYGDSGKTTFFISSEADWKKHSADIVGEEIKVMRRINNRPVAVEAVLTRCGTDRRPVHVRVDRLQATDAVPRRLVRQRDVPRSADRRKPPNGNAIGPAARRPAGQGGLSRILRGRRARRHRHR